MKKQRVSKYRGYFSPQEIDPATGLPKVFDIGQQFAATVPIRTRSWRWLEKYAGKFIKKSIAVARETYAVARPVKGISANPANSPYKQLIKTELVNVPAPAGIGDLGKTLVTGKKADSEQRRLEHGDRYEDLSSAARHGYVPWTDVNGKVHMAPLSDEQRSRSQSQRLAHYLKKQEEEREQAELLARYGTDPRLPTTPEPDRKQLDAEILIARAKERAETARRADTLHLPAKSTAAPKAKRVSKSAALARRAAFDLQRLECPKTVYRTVTAAEHEARQPFVPGMGAARRVTGFTFGGAGHEFVGCATDPCHCAAALRFALEGEESAAPEDEPEGADDGLEGADEAMKIERPKIGDEATEPELKGYDDDDEG